VRSTPKASPIPRILVVEDSRSARRLLQELLFRLGATPQNLRLVADANEALRVAAEWHPELVLLDMELRPSDSPSEPQPSGRSPPLNGEDLGRHLLQADPKLPIVVVTALDPQHPRVRELRKTGAVDVIVKPVRAAKVQEVLERLGVRFGGESWRSSNDPSERGPGSGSR
jgi:CheY-like chemotaxis protein